ncbi:MAG: ArnT family glycosyltransferase [Microgenomates group bacterium]
MLDIVSIFNFFKKNFSKKDFLVILGLIGFYFFTRLINLELLPIFGDEGIYIRWAKTAWHDASWRFISLTDGRQPLQTWATIPFLKLFLNQPLFAGRLFGVFFGFLGLLGMYSFLFYLWGKKAALIGTILYLFSPFLLFYQRMALADSAVATFYIYLLFFSILLIKTLRLDISLIFGLIAGLALLTKSTTQLFIIAAIFAPITVYKKISKEFIIKKINFLILFIISLIIAISLYNIQRLSPFMHYISEKNKTFVLTFSEWFKNPFLVFPSNIKIIPYYLIFESGFLIVFFSILGLRYLFKKNWQLGCYLLIWFFVPFFAIALFSKIIFPRYLIYLNALLIILASYFFISIKKKKLAIFSLIFLLLTLNIFNYPILFKPEKIFFPEIDKGQYITGITAGYGIKEIIDYARKLSSEKPVVILAEGDFGVVGDQLQTFLLPKDKIFVKGYWPLDERQLLENKKLLKDNFVLVVFSHRNKFPDYWPLKLIKKFSKPENKSALYLFELVN